MKLKNMPKKKDSKVSKTKETKKKKDDEEEKEGGEAEATNEEVAGNEDLDPSIIEDSFDEFSEYNDVDNF